MQAATMPLESDPTRTDAPPRRVLQIFLLALAIVETLIALSNVPTLFGKISEIPGTDLGGLTITVVIAISPFVAFTALVFALTGRIPHAIVAVATLGLLDWLNYLPSFTLQDLVPNASLGSILTLVQFLVFPTICVAAIRLSLRDERLGLATAMAAMPTLISILMTIAFGIGVAIHGF